MAILLGRAAGQWFRVGDVVDVVVDRVECGVVHLTATRAGAAAPESFVCRREQPAEVAEDVVVQCARAANGKCHLRVVADNYRVERGERLAGAVPGRLPPNDTGSQG